VRRRVPLVVVLIVAGAVTGPFAGAAKHTASPHERAQRAQATVGAEQRVGRELVALRTRTSKTFVGRNGERVARLYSGSVHYRDAGGRWRDIDTRFVRRDGRLLNRTNSFSTSLPQELGKDTVRVRKGKQWLAFSLRGARGSATAHRGSARYADALPGVDAVYTQQLDSVKEDLVLRGPESRRRFAFDLSMARGLRPHLLRSGALALRDARGRTRLSLGAPFMVDARRRTQRVRSRLSRVDGGWRLSYVPSDAWLDRRGRAWPVVVDPVIEPNPDGDCYLNASQPDSSFCSANPMKVGMVGGHDHTIVMRFPLSGIPRGAEVAGATVVATATGDQNTSVDTQVELRPLTEPFTTAASWNRNNGTDRWSDPGGEGDASSRAEFPGWTTGGQQYWTMLKLVREWVSGKRANHGLVLSVPTGSDGVWLDSAESTANKPYLAVQYKERFGDRRGWVHERQQLSDRISMGVNVGSGNLMVQQKDFSMPGGLGPAVSVSRTYNSLEDDAGGLGEWTLDTAPDIELVQFAGGNFMRLRYPSGAKGVYDKDPQTGKYKTPPGFNNTIEKDVPATGKWQLTDHGSQTKYRFENYTKSGRLYEIEDRNGRKLTFVYNATTNRLERIEDSNNDAAVTTDDVRFTWASSSQLSQMTDPAGRTYGYGYTGALLTSYTDPQNGASFKTLYEYNGPGSKLSKITTPQGNVTTIAYYPTGHEHAGRVNTVTRVTDTVAMTGPTTTFEYILRRDGSGETRVTDPIGTATADDNDRITRHVFDELGRVTKTVDALGRETSQKFTSNSKVESYTAASNSGTTPNTSASFDSDDNQTRSDSPAGTGSIRSCADFGATDGQPCDSAPTGYAGVPSGVQGSKYLPGRATDATGGRTNFSWQDTGATDTNGNLHGVQQTDNAGNQVAAVTMQWGTAADGKKGQLNSITDGRSNVTSYAYTDGKGNVNTVTPPNPGAPNPVGPTRMTYDLNLARVAKVQDGKDNWRLLTYDNLDRLTKIEFTGADQVLGSTEPYVQYTYDRDGNQTQEDTREQGTGTLRTRSMGYDKLNRVTSENLPGGLSNTYTYDLVGNLRSLTDGGGKVEYTYNAVNEIRAVYDPGTAKPTKFEHTKDGQRTKTTYPNGVTIDQAYDEALRLAEIHARNGSAATLQKFTYAYRDPSTSRQTPMVFEKTDGTLGQTSRYAYDGLDRLDTATIKSSTGDWTTNATLAKYDYDLDAAGNVVKRSVSGSQAPNAITDLGYNAFNELCAQQAGTTTSTPPACPATSPPFTYDKNGNELTAPGRSSSYDLADHTTLLGGVAMVYLGSGQNRKTGEGTATLQHNVLGLGRRTAGTSTDTFTRDEGGKLVSRRNGTTRHYYLFDALGSVTGVTDSTGAVSDRYDYEPYGAPAPRGAGQWAAATGAADVANGQFGFAAGYRSVNGLYHFGRRYYDPSLMRWTQPDPLDQTGDLREGNRYSYVGGDPINKLDPTGTHYRGSGGSPGGPERMPVCQDDSYRARFSYDCDDDGGVDDAAKGCARGVAGGQLARVIGSGLAGKYFKFNPWVAAGSCIGGAITGSRD
jgi:RHS repeat-associated protein